VEAPPRPGVRNAARDAPPVLTARRVYAAGAVWNSGLIVCGLGGTLDVEVCGVARRLLVEMLNERQLTALPCGAGHYETDIANTDAHPRQRRGWASSP